MTTPQDTGNDTGRGTGTDSGQDPAKDSGRVLSFADAAAKKPGAAQDADAAPEPARFEKHELHALFNLRAEYPNLAKDYIVANPQADAMVAFLESAGDAEPLAVFLKGGSDADPVYLVAGPGLASLSSSAMRDVIDHARDHLADLQARRDSASRADAARKSFKVV